MKNFILLIAMIATSVLQGQELTSFNLGEDQKVFWKNKTEIQLESGKLHRVNTSSKKDYVLINDGAITLRETDAAYCYTTNPILVHELESIRFSLDLSGTGTLDSEIGTLQDWVDIAYIIDEEIYQVGDGDHTITGVPQPLDFDWIKLENNQTFRLQVCMHNTGADETYTLSNISFEKKIKQAENLKDLKEGIIDIAQSVELTVFPSPSSEFVQFKSPQNYDLSQIRVMDAAGRTIIENVSYPIQCHNLTAGQYFISVFSKETNEFVQSSFVVVK